MERALAQAAVLEDGIAFPENSQVAEVYVRRRILEIQAAALRTVETRQNDENH